MKSRSHTVIVFATWMEAGPFLLQTSAEWLRDDPFGLFWLADRELLVLITGMGSASTIRAMAWLFQHFQVSRVCNCGVAGALNDAMQVGEISNIRFVAQENDHNALNFAFLADWPGSTGSMSCRLVSVSRGLFEPRRRRYWQGFAELVDMEGATIAQVCKNARVPCHICKVVSDYAGHRAELRNNLNRVSALMADWLCECLPRVDIRSAA